MSTERGYKKALDSKYDVRDYVVNEYTIITSESFEGVNTSFTGGGEVNNGSHLSFTYRSNELKPMKLSPRPVQIVSEVEDIVSLSGSTISVQKEGEFTVVFDNGLGELKELTFNSVRPAPSRISASLSASTMFVGNSVTLTAEISPEQALQDYTVSLKNGSTCTVDITKNEDGTFTITGLTEGEGTLVVASTDNPSIETELTFSVIAKPTMEQVTSLLTNNTLYYSESYVCRIYANFETDGTGAVRYDEYGWSGFDDGEIVTFTYTVNPDTLEISFEITGDQTTTSGYSITALNVLTSESISITFEYYSSSDTYTLTSYGEKIDLNN